MARYTKHHRRSKSTDLKNLKVKVRDNQLNQEKIVLGSQEYERLFPAMTTQESHGRYNTLKEQNV
jgi:hypothetical protein